MIAFQIPAITPLPASHAIHYSMKLVKFRQDGWPLCPVCDEDELGCMKTHEHGHKAQNCSELFCYRCGKVTVIQKLSS